MHFLRIDQSLCKPSKRLELLLGLNRPVHWAAFRPVPARFSRNVVVKPGSDNALLLLQRRRANISCQRLHETGSTVRNEARNPLQPQNPPHKSPVLSPRSPKPGMAGNPKKFPSKAQQNQNPLNESPKPALPSKPIKPSRSPKPSPAAPKPFAVKLETLPREAQVKSVKSTLACLRRLLMGPCTSQLLHHPGHTAAGQMHFRCSVKGPPPVYPEEAWSTTVSHRGEECLTRLSVDARYL